MMNKRTFFPILIMYLTASVSLAYDWSTNPGDGSAGNPYQIGEPNQLIAIGNEPNKLDDCYILLNDIVFDPDGDPNHIFTEAVIAGDESDSLPFYQGDGFGGVIDGDDYAIRNLTFNTTVSEKDFIGLFGKLAVTARIENLGVEIQMISSKYGSSCIGGICGENTGRITDCYTTGSISANYYIGGLCGLNKGYIKTSYSTVEVTGWSNLGGLCGLNTSSLDNCYALGNVTGDNLYVGGLCGEHWGSARNCYSAGRVISGGTFIVGGLSGSSHGYFKDSYWDRNTSGQMYSAGGWGKSTSEMKNESTFIGWDNGKWIINDGLEYPRLAWQATAGTAISTDYPARTYAGDGFSNPFEISSSQDLVCLMYRSIDWSLNFILVNDIDMSSVTDYFPPARFGGNFNGQNHVISNLTIDADVIGNQNQLGFIGSTSYSGEIRNLFLEDIEIYGTDYIGGICGYNHGDIIQCSVTGSINAINNNMEIVGGICGYNYGYLSNCASSCDLNTGDFAWYCGGLCGWNQEDIRQCYSTGTINSGESNRDIGGFCGINRDIIVDCYSLGTVYAGDGTESIGGFCGYNQDSISYCYTAGDIIPGQQCDEIGGICGLNYGGASINRCFWNSEIQTGGVTVRIGEEANGSATAYVFAKTTDQMQRQSTYTSYGWDFPGDSNGNDDLWTICEEMNYPRLVWQVPEGDFVCPNGVGLEDFSLLSECWFAAGQSQCAPADMNHDGVVESQDLLEFISHWLEMEN